MKCIEWTVLMSTKKYFPQSEALKWTLLFFSEFNQKIAVTEDTRLITISLQVNCKYTHTYLI